MFMTVNNIRTSSNDNFFDKKMQKNQCNVKTKIIDRMTPTDFVLFGIVGFSESTRVSRACNCATSCLFTSSSLRFFCNLCENKLSQAQG